MALWLLIMPALPGGGMVWLTRCSQSTNSTPGPVSDWMGDCLLTDKPSWYVTSHLGQLSLPSLRGR